jgi:hypothetical protein
MPEQTAQETTTETPPAGGTGEQPSGDKPVGDKPAGDKAQEQKTGDKPTGDQSLITGDQTTVVKPEDIKFKLPDGVKVDEKFLGDFRNVAAELGLKGDSAQKLVDLHLGFVERVSKEFETTIENQGKEWYSELEKDSEFGGSKFQENALSVHKAVQKFGGTEFRKAIDEMGLGNWPPLAKFLARVGAGIKDDTAALDEKPPQTTPANDEDAFARALYGERTPQLFERKG